jgi:hypothetical protein
MLSQVYHHGVQQRHTAEFCNSGYELPKNREIRSLAGQADDGALRNQQHVRGIAPAHVIGFIVAQLCGALIGLLLSRFLLSTSTSPRPSHGPGIE